MTRDKKLVVIGCGASIKMMTPTQYGQIRTCVGEELACGGGAKWILNNGEHVWSRHEGILWEWVNSQSTQKACLHVTSTTDSVYCNGVECLAL